MIRVRFLLPAVLLLAAHTAAAQTLHGVVFEDSSRTPITGVLVELLGQAGSTYMSQQTDSLGTFLFRPAPGRYRVRLSHPSYRAAEDMAVHIRRDDLLAVELRLGRAAIPLQPIVVASRRDAAELGGFEERRRAGVQGYFLTREDIRMRSAATRVTDLLLTVPGVQIVPVREGSNAPGTPPNPYARPQLTYAPTYLITLRDRVGDCQPAIFVEGMRVRQDTQAGVDEFLTPEMIEAVEVYPNASGLPSQFIAANTCGAVLFWSRRVPADGGAGWRTRLIAAGGALFLVLGGAFLW